ncbi:AsmA family protein, partial [Bradyrhizobium sp.]|uniref:AsmA family protein n=1 Tax=Bradyrhizobium sp. TaxID=376 RepID=UPI003C3A0B23
MKLVKLVSAAVAAIIVLLALVMIVGVPSGLLTSAIQDRVERETGYHLAIAGTTRLSLWPSLNVTLSDITLQDPKDRDTTDRVTIASLQAGMTLSSAWSGHPEISELVIDKPVLYVPLLRERNRAVVPPAKTAAHTNASDTVTIDRIRVTNGSIVFSNPRDRVENRIEAVNADAVIGADREVRLTGTARAGGDPLTFEIKTTAPAAERKTVPVELTLEAPGLLRSPLTGTAEVRMNGSVVMINGVSGRLDNGAFTGWASVDLVSKPLVKVDLDLQHLAVAMAKNPTGATSSGAQPSGSQPSGSQSSGSQPWSNAPLNLTGLNYVDAQVRLSAAQLEIADAHFAAAEIDATLAAGVLKAAVSNLGAYGGQASGELIVDASSGIPSYAMHCDLVGIRALPLLQSLAEFDKIDGKMQAKIAAKSQGASQRAIMSSLAGTAFINFQDGAIKGVNVAQMIRSLTSSPLSGWQQQPDQATDLSQLSASFRIDRGQATTTDLNLIGPLVKVTGTGTIDLGTKMLGFRVEPKLVMTTEGQGRTSDPIGFGIPVMIDGSWSEPRIYPDMAGVLDNPDAAYAKLREMGKGLFGANGGGLGDLLGGLGRLAGSQSGTGGASGDSGSGGVLGGNLGAALGGLIQQG